MAKKASKKNTSKKSAKKPVKKLTKKTTRKPVKKTAKPVVPAVSAPAPTPPVEAHAPTEGMPATDTTPATTFKPRVEIFEELNNENQNAWFVEYEMVKGKKQQQQLDADTMDSAVHEVAHLLNVPEDQIITPATPRESKN